MLRIPILPLVLATVTIGSPAPGAIFDADDRRAVTVGSDLRDAIGRARYGRRSATAFMVARCLAVSSQHLVGTRSTVIGQRVQLRLGNQRLAALVVAEGGLQHRRDALDVSGDWIVLRLDRCRPAGAAMIALPIGDRARPLSSAPVASAGFPADLSGLSLDPSCRVRASYKGTLLHDCAAYPGSSGSPIFRADPATGQLVALAIQAAGWKSRAAEPFTMTRANLATPAHAIAAAVSALSAPPAPVVGFCNFSWEVLSAAKP